jgi:hypothetical protein
VPTGLRNAGWELVTLAEYYGQPEDEHVADEVWLADAGRRGWAVLMKDERIRYRSAEIAALRSARVHAFCLARGNLRIQEMVAMFVRYQADIFAICMDCQGPTLHVISGAGMRTIDLA